MQVVRVVEGCHERLRQQVDMFLHGWTKYGICCEVQKLFCIVTEEYSSEDLILWCHHECRNGGRAKDVHSFRSLVVKHFVLG